MKKRLFGLVLAGLLCFSPVSAFAAEVTPITVSSGIDLYQEETESTFDSSRTIYGQRFLCLSAVKTPTGI